MKNLLATFRFLTFLALAIAGLAPAALAATVPQVALLTPMTAGLKSPVRLATDQAGFI